MIAYFPELYPDELLYSLFARLYVKGGYTTYRYCAEDLFINPTARADIEFINALTPDVAKMLTRNMSIDDIILQHTMFPYYARFLPKKRKNKAFYAMRSMKGNYSNLLPLPKSKNGSSRYLRFCPLCVEDDRKKYYETYWHRNHQMIGVNVCPLHGCRLMDSDVIISNKTSPSLITAEEIASSQMQSEDLGNMLDCVIAEYVSAVFQADIDLESDVLVGDFLHSRMSGTKYLSVRGEQRNIALLHTDFAEYYRGLSNNWFTELWQIQKVLTNDRVNCYEICLLSLFLNISAADLVKMTLPEKSQQQLFDDQIHSLHKQGLKYPEIAKRLNASYDVVKAIGEKKYKSYKKELEKTLKSGAKVRDWNQIDRDTLPFVKDAIRKLYGDGISRPKKISIYAIERMLKLPSKRISKYLPLCRAEIEKYHESQEQYWAREVVWAIDKVLRDGEAVNWKHIRNLTNMKKSNLIACMLYLPDEKKHYVSYIVNT